MHGEVVQQLNGLFCPLQCAARSKLDFLLPCVVEKFRCYVLQYIIFLYMIGIKVNHLTHLSFHCGNETH
jgi:hypothetical protein